jgi:transposase
VKKYIVRLTDQERQELRDICSKGRHSARKLRKANILLESDKGQIDEEISKNLCVGQATVERTRKRFVEGNLKYALSEVSRVGRPRKFDGIQRTALIALACTNPPQGRAVWTAELLAQQMVLLGVVDFISPRSVRMILSEEELKPWQKQEWCNPRSTQNMSGEWKRFLSYMPILLIQHIR